MVYNLFPPNHEQAPYGASGLAPDRLSRCCSSRMSLSYPIVFQGCVQCQQAIHGHFHRNLSARRSVLRSNHVHRLSCRPVCAMSASSRSHDEPSDDLSTAFAREMASRNEAQEKALEQGEAAAFGGRQLLEALQSRSACSAVQPQSLAVALACYAAHAVARIMSTMCINACRYGRSYDVSIVQRKYLGKVIIACNIMWKYREQVSFGVSRHSMPHRALLLAACRFQPHCSTPCI